MRPRNGTPSCAAAVAATDAKHLACHVLDDAHHRHIQPVEGGKAAGGIGQGDGLRCADNDPARQRHRLGQAHLRIAGAGRQVHHQVVEVAPRHVGQQLLDAPCAASDRATPAPRRPAPGNRSTSLRRRVRRRAPSYPPDTGGRLVDAHHHRHVGPVDVGIEDPDLGAHLAKATARLTATVVLPTPPLPLPDRDDVLDRYGQLAGDAVVGTHLSASKLTFTCLTPGSCATAACASVLDLDCEAGRRASSG